MKKILTILIAVFCIAGANAQFIYKIKADSVLITNDSCTAELILENSTKNIKGFLYNTGNGRTEFRLGLVQINDSTYLIGDDTLKIKGGNFFNPWLQGGNAFAATGKLGLTDSNHIDLYTNNILRGRLTAGDGNLLLGTTTDNGEKLQVNGSIFTSTGTIKSNGGVSVPPAISFFGNQDAGNVFIGHNTAPAWADKNPYSIMIQSQKNTQSNATKVGQVTIGASNVDSSTKDYGILIGALNKQLDGSYYGGTVIGHSINYAPSASSQAGDILIGNGIVYSGHSSIILGGAIDMSLSNVFVAAGNANNGQGGITNIFFGNGYRAHKMHNAGNGLSYTINGSGASDSTDRNGGDITLAGGKGTGAGTPGDLVFSTSTALSSGTTFQTSANRWWIKGSSGYLSNSSTPTSLLDLSGANGYSQLRLRTSYTPSSTSDTNGNTGDVCWDDNYIYIKTSAGWKRAALSSF